MESVGGRRDLRTLGTLSEADGLRTSTRTFLKIYVARKRFVRNAVVPHPATTTAMGTGVPLANAADRDFRRRHPTRIVKVDPAVLTRCRPPFREAPSRALLYSASTKPWHAM